MTPQKQYWKVTVISEMPNNGIADVWTHEIYIDFGELGLSNISKITDLEKDKIWEALDYSTTSKYTKFDDLIEAIDDNSIDELVYGISKAFSFQLAELDFRKSEEGNWVLRDYKVDTVDQPSVSLEQSEFNFLGALFYLSRK